MEFDTRNLRSRWNTPATFPILLLIFLYISCARDIAAKVCEILNRLDYCARQDKGAGGVGPG